jgi:DNA replication protein DnaC
MGQTSFQLVELSVLPVSSSHLKEVIMTKQALRSATGHDEVSFLIHGRNLSDFNFRRSPTVDESRFRQLYESDFVASGENVLIVGGAGTGKSHLAEALATQAARANHSVRVISGANARPFDGAHELLESKGLLDLFCRTASDDCLREDLLLCDLLLVEELPELSRHDVHWLAELLTSRAAAGRSTIIVSRRRPQDWIAANRLGVDTAAVLESMNPEPTACSRGGNGWFIFSTGDTDNTRLLM